LLYLHRAQTSYNHADQYLISFKMEYCSIIGRRSRRVCSSTIFFPSSSHEQSIRFPRSEAPPPHSYHPSRLSPSLLADLQGDGPTGNSPTSSYCSHIFDQIMDNTSQVLSFITCFPIGLSFFSLMGHSPSILFTVPSVRCYYFQS
jgi:hypothetical protein